MHCLNRCRWLAPLACLSISLAWVISGWSAATPDDRARRSELDAYWGAVSRSVREGDFEGYRATCHEEGVLVSGTSKTSYPLAQALERWKPGFLDTRAGNMTASVEFRFSQRLGDATTAHETGIFRYATTDATGQAKTNFVHFEALLVKRTTWKILMEYQKGPATLADWEHLNQVAIHP
ncbi:MAG: hypothetical protein JNK85_00770 [Verrucomicrobiales bacterium]|nr:hypothetical protein [Verrucomicrobiales bacterium]